MEKLQINQANFIQFCKTEITAAPKEPVIIAVIEQSGGWDELLKNRNALMTNWRLWQSTKHPKRGLEVFGWASVDELSEFYQSNKAAILDLAASKRYEADGQTVLEMVAEFDSLGGIFDLDEIAEGMHVVGSPNYSFISAALANFCAVSVAFPLDVFVEIHSKGQK